MRGRGVQKRLQALSLRYEQPPVREDDRVESLIDDNLALYGGRHKLSKREQEVLRLILLGIDNQNIASTMGVAASTAKVHVHNILRKTGHANRQDLIQDFWSTWCRKNAGTPRRLFSPPSRTRGRTQNRRRWARVDPPCGASSPVSPMPRTRPARRPTTRRRGRRATRRRRRKTPRGRRAGLRVEAEGGGEAGEKRRHLLARHGVVGAEGLPVAVAVGDAVSAAHATASACHAPAGTSAKGAGTCGAGLPAMRHSTMATMARVVGPSGSKGAARFPS